MAAAMDDYGRLHALLRSTVPLSESGEGGSHTDVLRFDRDALRVNVADAVGAEALPPSLERLVEELASRYLVKKGKIHYFSMPLTGAETNHIRRNMTSYAFGPVGYNLMPTYAKAVVDAHEAARLIPYFGGDDPKGLFAPDFLEWMASPPSDDRVPANESATFLRTAMRGPNVTHTAYDLLSDDEYFHARAGSWAELEGFGSFVRRNPLVSEMEERLAAFFEAPITVGLRDTLRWVRGSRHHSMPWTDARDVIETCFERCEGESFLLPEINYYAYDTSYTPAQIDTIYRRNQVVARLFNRQVIDALPAEAQAEWHRSGGEQLAFELLDFHHDYPLYEVEPYAGFFSGMMLRFSVRFAWGLFSHLARLRGPVVRNVDLRQLPELHQGIGAFLGNLEDAHRERSMSRLGELLERHQRDGLLDRHGDRLEFTRIPRTFYTFQQRADVPSPGRQVRSMRALDELWTEPGAQLWHGYPDLADKLVVFFTLIYRYYRDTGFVADLRPRDAGRDIFVYGVWGYVTENLLIVEDADEHGASQVRVVFVDNRDQFKEYRRDEDRRRPLGPAKYALRLTYPLIEPAMQRAIGIFVHKVRKAQGADEDERPAGPRVAAERGLDVARAVVQSSVDAAFVNTKAVVDDLVDDVHVGAKRTLSELTKKIERWTRR